MEGCNFFADANCVKKEKHRNVLKTIAHCALVPNMWKSKNKWFSINVENKLVHVKYSRICFV